MKITWKGPVSYVCSLLIIIIMARGVLWLYKQHVPENVMFIIFWVWLAFSIVIGGIIIEFIFGILED